MIIMKNILIEAREECKQLNAYLIYQRSHIFVYFIVKIGFILH